MDLLVNTKFPHFSVNCISEKPSYKKIIFIHVLSLNLRGSWAVNGNKYLKKNIKTDLP